MDEHGTPDPLKSLGERLEKARRARERPVEQSDGASGVPSGTLGVAFRIGIELVAALVVSVGIGWLIDHWLGTRPWAMVVFFFLGAAAGVMNVYRSVMGLGMAVGYRRQGGDEDKEA